MRFGIGRAVAVGRRLGCAGRGGGARGCLAVRLRVSLNVKRAPVFGEIGGALLACAGVDRSCATTVGGSDVEGRGRPVA